MQYQITADLVESTGCGTRVGWVPRKEFPLTRDRYQNTEGLLVVKTHKLTDAIREEFERGNAAAIYIYRDLRDVALSLIRKGHARIPAEWWDPKIINECIANHNDWTRERNVLVSRYEEAVVDWAREAGRIAGHLGLDCGPEIFDDIAARYSIENQRRRISEAEDDAFQEVRPGGIRQLRDHLLHRNHISDSNGAVGDWRTGLTAKQVNAIEGLAGHWLRENDYPVAPTWKRWLRSLGFNGT
ncbi:MAG: sulfotransferase domain-containing protein [Arenicellales bacterium]